MPVYKYKTFEEAERALWNFHPDKNYFEKLKDLWDFADKLNPIEHPHGVFKFKTLKEANQHRAKWEMAHAKKIQESRKDNSR